MNDKLKSLRDSAEYAEEKLVASAQSLLEEILIEKGMSKTDLAKRMGVSKARVSQIFSDHQNFTFRLMANAFHAVGEELVLNRFSQCVEYKSADTSGQGLELTFDDKTREITHGFEWLDGLVEIGSQPVGPPHISKQALAELLAEAMQTAFEHNPSGKMARKASDVVHDPLDDWSNRGENVIPMMRKKAS